MWENLRTDALDWCEGKSWIWRTILLAYLTYAGFRYGTDSHYASIFEGISFGIHEIGHLLFSPLGKFLMVAGGTITELAAPVAAGFILLRQRDYFGLSVTGCWLSYCTFSVAKYMGDARAQNLPLLGLSRSTGTRLALLAFHHWIAECRHCTCVCHTCDRIRNPARIDHAWRLALPQHG